LSFWLVITVLRHTFCYTLIEVLVLEYFFFSSRRRHTRFSRDWSSDVCSSDLHTAHGGIRGWFERIGTVLSGEPRDREELLELLRDAQKRNLFDADAQAMLEGVLAVADMQVRDVMVPRSQMAVIERDTTLAKEL